jgi:hypothetical protein
MSRAAVATAIVPAPAPTRPRDRAPEPRGRRTTPPRRASHLALVEVPVLPEARGTAEAGARQAPQPSESERERTRPVTPAAPAAGPVPEEVPTPAFELPPAPETALSPEEQAARDAAAAAAEAALAQADTAEAVVAAYAVAPPTVKAATQSLVGGRLQEVIAADQREFQAGIPEFHVTMTAGEGPEAAPDLKAAAPVEAPALEPVVLEASVPPPAPEPDLPPVAPPEPYTANSAVVSLLSSLFGAGAAEAIGRSLGAVRTTDHDIDTSPGETPAVPLEGDTDPSRLSDQERTGQAHVRAQRDAATLAVMEGRGPEQTQLREMDELVPTAELAPAQIDGLAGDPEADSLLQRGLPEEVLAQFDRDMAATMEGSLAEARAQFGQAEAQRDEQRTSAVSTAERERDRLTQEADAGQRRHVLAARETIQAERQQAIDAQGAAVGQLETDAAQARAASETVVDDRVREDEARIAERYDQAERDAQAEVRQGERDAEAARERAEREAEESSWWDRAVDFVRDALAALTSFISDIFDAVRAVVKGLLDAARDFAKGLIDLAADFIKGAIAAFGEVLKGLIDVTVGQVFPQLAADLNAGIDSAVQTASAAVDAVADLLKAGVDAVVDTLNAAIDAVINAFQAAVTMALAVMEAAITGDWSALARKLLESVLRLLGIDPAAFYAFIGRILHTLDLILDDPLDFLSHLVDAVLLGFQRFADNFLVHLQAGIIAWLTGALGGIQIPSAFDLLGLLDLARQILGLTWEWVRAKAVRLVGEENVARIEFILSYVQTLVTGGFPALWERLRDEFGGLVDTVLGAIREFLVEKVIVAGITWIASLFNPVGALVKLVLTIWNLYTFVRDQLARIVRIAQTLVESLASIAAGIIDAAASRVESALAGLLPVAINLVANLLGLTGVAARVREIIGSARDWIDRAIDRLLDRVVRAFSSGGETAVAGAGDAATEGAAPQAAGAIGDPLPVDVAEGPDHVLTIAAAGANATVMLASDPLPVSRWLDSFSARVPQLEGDAAQSDATARIAEARARLATLDPEADAYLAARAGGATPDQADLRADEIRLRDALVDVFNAFSGRGAAIVDVFASEISAAHSDAQPQIRKALKEHDTELSAKAWPEVRALVTANYNPFQRPLLAEHKFGRDAQAEALRRLPEGASLDDSQRASFLKDWLARLVNTSDDPPFAAARTALQALLFEGRALASCSELTGAVAEALARFQGSGEKPDADLVAEVSGKVLPFLTAVARGEAQFGRLDLSRWESDYWGRPANQEWLKDRFRGSGGAHEWIPTNYVGRVVERGRASARAEDLETAALWVTFQDELRSPTRILMYPPEGRYARTVPNARDPVTHEPQPGGERTVLQGHVGAVYAPVGGDNDYRGDVVAQTQAQGPWHDDLRKIFDANQGAGLATMRKVVQAVTLFAADHLWFGDAVPRPGFTEYYGAAKGTADGDGLVSFDHLQQVASGAADAIDNDFERARRAVGM